MTPPRVVALALCLPLPLVHAQETRTLRQITVTGTAYERGLQHGEQLKGDIAAIVAKWKANATAALGRDADAVLDDFFVYAAFDDAVREWTPELYEEVLGIADGSGQEFRDIYVLNLLDEFWVYVDNTRNHHCSGLGVPARDGRPAFIAQNMDLEAYTDGYQVLMRVPAHGGDPEQLILTHAGLIGLNGLNASGVGVCVNTLMQLKASSRGVPVAFVVREIIRRTGKDEILDFIQKVPHASGQNYIIGVRDEVFDFEASAGQVVRYQPENPNAAVYHTNHPLANDDVKPWYAAHDPSRPAAEQPAPDNSRIRLAAVERRVGAEGAVDTDLIMATLRSRDDDENPVCRTRRDDTSGFTFASVIMTLSGEPRLEIVAGPPDEGEYAAFDFGR